MDTGFYTENAYNRLVNLDNIEWHVIDYLAHSDSKYADYLWKILKYDTPDALSKPSLTYEEKMALVYTNNGDSTPYRVFMSPFLDDAWELQCSHLHVYIHSIEPQTHLTSKVNVAIECITHNKVTNVIGDASKFNSQTNPVELANGTINTPYKSRVTVMTKSIIGDLNGRFVNGVGSLQFNSKISAEDKSKFSLWNGRKFFGQNIVMTTLMSGESIDSDCGY